MKSIKVKIVSMSLLLLAIPALIIGLVGFFQAKQHLNELGQTNLKNGVKMAIQMAQGLDEEVSKGHIPLEEAQEEVKTALIGPKNADGTRTISNKIDLGKNGYFFILDEKGNELAHPSLEGKNVWDSKDQNGKYFIHELLKKAKAGGGFVSYDWPLPNNKSKQAEKTTYSEVDPNWGWAISAGTYSMDFNKSADAILYILLITLAIALIVGSIITLLFSKHLATPIKKLSVQMGQLASGNLSTETVEVKRKDEIGQLMSSMNFMKEKLRNMILDITKVSDHVTSQSEELTQYADEVGIGTTQIATTMQELSNGAEEQANSASTLLEKMSDFSQTIMQVAMDGENVKENSKQMLTMTEDGGKDMYQSVKQMHVIDERIKQSLEMVKGLDNKTSQITDLVNVIKEISEQTNLLSLNAAIEAARAGEHGKGFAVVADEVRKLADQVTQSITNITSIVADIQNESTQVVDTLKDSYQLVTDGTKQINVTGETFKKLKDTIESSSKQVESMAASMFNILDNTREINESIDTIASVSEETAAGVEEVTATTEQSSSSMEEVAKTAKMLEKQAANLNEMVQRFKF
ncbi:methyl-accepting chemotaxis protein [Bacillus sp. FJAT-49736]|uniref:methyl-accepting chemotaxis protein n=1 Tax=Bacillus sp. FJAT-49736 TaxID=2833582 RepID=UPI001BCA1AA4|nr:methyl-accepting chemotaxis protein [Bacillus sp. FJAT-49736]MBS4174092.1 methyl-accepting chemotaxis protein [Bacillus sp. FJAT-49736]